MISNYHHYHIIHLAELGAPAVTVSNWYVYNATMDVSRFLDLYQAATHPTYFRNVTVHTLTSVVVDGLFFLNNYGANHVRRSQSRKS